MGKGRELEWFGAQNKGADQYDLLLPINTMLMPTLRTEVSDHVHERVRKKSIRARRVAFRYSSRCIVERSSFFALLVDERIGRYPASTIEAEHSSGLIVAMGASVADRAQCN
jgi:hypothetical protein